MNTKEKIMQHFKNLVNKQVKYSQVENVTVSYSVNEPVKKTASTKDEDEKDKKEETEEKPKKENKEETEEKPKKENEEETEEKPKKERFINLQIKLDSWSPIYEMFGMKYKEKIDLNCFDKKTPIEKQELYSYVDHDISIEKMIGSTLNNSMEVHKKDNVIFAKVKVNEEDTLAKKTADLIEQGVLKSNSFIFIAKDIEQKYFEKKEKTDYNNNEIDLEIVYKEGELISIDPVYKGFYPQCETSISNSVEREYKEEQMDPKETLQTIAVESDSIERSAELQEETKKQIEEIVEARVNSSSSTLIKKVLQEQKEMNKEFSYEEVREKWLKREVLNDDEYKVLRNEANLNDSLVASEAKFALGKDYKAQLEQRTLDGTNKQNGLALIEILQNKRILSEWMQVFPELSEYAQIIPIVGLNKVDQSILIPDKTAVSKIAEGAASTKQGGKTTNVRFEPDRYSVEVNQNNQLNNFNATLASQTDSVKDNIRYSLRKALYQNMFANVSANLDLDSYTGGATKEAVVKTADAAKLTLADVDAVVKKIIAKWGNEAVSKYNISMHIDTLTHLEKEYFGSGSTLWKDVYDPVKRTFRGIQIIMLYDDLYEDKTIETGKNAMIFWVKSSIIAYGCSFAIQDSPYELMSEDQSARFVRLRGQIKLCDPNLNTIVLQIA